MIAQPPSAGARRKDVELAAFGDSNLSAELFFNGVDKWLPDIPVIGQNTLNR